MRRVYARCTFGTAAMSFTNYYDTMGDRFSEPVTYITTVAAAVDRSALGRARISGVHTHHARLSSFGGGGHARKCVAPNAVVCPNIFTTLRRFLFREREKKTLHVHTYTYYYIVPMCIRHDVSTPLCIIWFPQAAAQRLSCRPAETTPMGKTARRILCIVHSRAYVPILYHTYPCINGKNGFYVRADRVCTV